MGDLVAVCARCGAAKDLPLGRCPACGDLPRGEGRELALICSARMLDPDALAQVQARVRRGEPLAPSPERRARARELLSGTPVEPVQLSGRQLLALTAANVLLTPVIGYGVWFRYRTRPGPGARQALVATVPVSVLLFFAILAWRWASIAGGRG